MGNQFYQPGSQRAEKVRELFNSIARRYDLINDIQSIGLHRYWKRRLIQMARIQPGDKVLDVCCGTGDLAFRMSRAGAEVTAVDFCESMLEQARLRSKALPKSPRFVQGDAMNLPFSDRSFAVVTIGYGLRNLSDFVIGIQELVRVTKPGGRVMILDFSSPTNSLWRNIYYCYLQTVLPLYGWLFCRNAAAYSYVLESLRHYPSAEKIACLLEQSGCQKVMIHHYIGGVMTIHEAILRE